MKLRCSQLRLIRSSAKRADKSSDRGDAPTKPARMNSSTFTVIAHIYKAQSSGNSELTKMITDRHNADLVRCTCWSLRLKDRLNKEYGILAGKFHRGEERRWFDRLRHQKILRRADELDGSTKLWVLEERMLVQVSESYLFELVEYHADPGLDSERHVCSFLLPALRKPQCFVWIGYLGSYDCPNRTQVWERGRRLVTTPDSWYACLSLMFCHHMIQAYLI